MSPFAPSAARTARFARPLFAAAMLAVFFFAAWLRLAHLESAPLHYDEATGARIAGRILDSGGPAFDPAHHHGPLFARGVQLAAFLRGETGWLDLTATSVRLPTALGGLALVLAALISSRFVGPWPALAAAALAAADPFLAHYARIGIHESLFLGCCAAAVLALGAWAARPSLAAAFAFGVATGLAAATRETFVIPLATWFVAAAVVRPALLRELTPARIAVAVGAAFVVAGLFYTDFARNPAGLWQFVSTYWRYEVTPGHEKPFGYYFELLLTPTSHGRLRWWIGGAAVLALLAWIPRSLRRGSRGDDTGPAIPAARWLFLAGVLQLLVFSCLGYKTPWLALVGWSHVVIAGGFVAGDALSRVNCVPRVALLALFSALVVFHAQQAWRVAFLCPSDQRNPYVYVPTATSVPRWTARAVDWLRAARADEQPAAVLGSRYWPLPWYLRRLSSVGYWTTAPGSLETFPLVITLPDTDAATLQRLEQTHVGVPEGLRTDTPVLVWFRRDVWDANTRAAATASPAAVP